MAEALRVLIADDEPIARMDLREMLQSLGHAVIAEATDGDAALSLARSDRPDLAILDIRMPGTDGLEVARLLAAEHICPTLIASAFAKPEYVTASVDSGGSFYLVKPYRESDLMAAITMTIGLSNRFAQLERELANSKEALDTRKIVERAKGLLMDRLRLSEAEAFRRIQQESMNSRRRMRDVAQQILTDGA